MRKYTCILFDLDGTLTHSHPGIYACIRYALKEMGKAEPTMEQLRLCVGPTLMYSFQNYFGLPEEEAQAATVLYRKRYAAEGMWENAPIEGALETLKILKERGYRLAMATSKPLMFASQIAKKFGFSEYFDVEAGSGMDDGTLPTKASVIAEAMRQLGVGKEDCLMVGDRKHDAEGAKENGVDCALLKVGYAENEEEFVSAAPKYVFTDFEGLKALLL